MKRDSAFIVIGIGIALELAGLGLDAFLHYQDELLAAHECIFTLTNPGHLIFLTGLGLSIVGILLRIATRLSRAYRSDYWQRGLATEAASAVRDYAFNVLYLPRLVSLIRVGNLASKRVAEKVGMKQIQEFTRNGIRYSEFGMQAEK